MIESGKTEAAGGRLGEPANRPVEALSVHPYNLQVYGEPDGGLRDSLAQFGLQQPVVVDEQDRILSGARRWKGATLLGWSELETRTYSGAAEIEEKKFVLLANAYRATKPDYVRKLEADAYLALLKSGDMSKADLRALAEERGAVTDGYNGQAPTALAAAVSGMSRMTYSRLRFVLDGGAERAIDRARRSGEVDAEQASSLGALVLSLREKLQRGSVGAHTADRRVRTALQEAQRLHSMTEEQRSKDAARARFSVAVGKGTSFLAAVRDLDAQVQFLDAAQARSLAGILAELGAVTAELGKRARAGSPLGPAPSVTLPPLRVPAHLHERLRGLARLRGCSISTLLEQILEDNVGLQEMASRTPPVASPLVGYGGAPAMRPEGNGHRRARGTGVRAGR